MRAARVDENQREVVAALRAAGASVQSLASVSAAPGCPDLLVGYRGATYLLEVKDGSKPPSARNLTPYEAAWHMRWRGRPVAVVESVEDALAACGIEVRR